MNQYLIALPEIYLIVLIMILLLSDVFAPKLNFGITFLGLLGLLGITYNQLENLEAATEVFKGAYVVDQFGLISKLILVGGGIITFLISGAYLKRINIFPGEYFLLILTSLLGMLLLVSANDLLMFFLSLELMSLPIFGLVGIKINSLRCSEAAIKYLVLGAFSTAIFLMGLAFAYGANGTISIESFREMLTKGGGVYAYLSAAFILVGVFFKVSIFPFHAWTPDVYEGAPAPITGFMSVCVKIAAFIATFRLFGKIEAIGDVNLNHVFAVFATITVIFGNILAVTQQNVKRILAYSSISNSGFMMLAFVGPNAQNNLLFYAVVYLIGNLIVFGALSGLAPQENKDEVTDVNELEGLVHEHPLMAIFILLGFLSIAGIPPFPGFFSKYLVIKDIIDGKMYLMAILVLISTVASMYYYLKVVVAMFMKENHARTAALKYSNSNFVALGLCIVGLVFLAILPALVIDRIGLFLGQ